MYKTVLKSIGLASFVVLFALPASAGVRADLGALHIRIATEAPPRVRHEHRSARPDRESVWINGYWDRQDSGWAWTSGRWEQPNDRHARWVKARYQREGRAWRYEPAHWSNQQVTEGDDYKQWREEHHSGHDQHQH